MKNLNLNPVQKIHPCHCPNCGRSGYIPNWDCINLRCLLEKMFLIFDILLLCKQNWGKKKEPRLSKWHSYKQYPKASWFEMGDNGNNDCLLFLEMTCSSNSTLSLKREKNIPWWPLEISANHYSQSSLIFISSSESVAIWASNLQRLFGLQFLGKVFFKRYKIWMYSMCYQYWKLNVGIFAVLLGYNVS